MPKDKTSRNSASAKVRNHPYKPRGKGSKEENAEEGDGRKEWEDVICPICLEYPHNAVLLLCSSHEKGCRPYMCNTSYRHSNCLDQYRKAQVEMHKPQAPIQVILEAETHRPQHLVDLVDARSSEENAGQTNGTSAATMTRRLRRRLVNGAVQSTDNAVADSRNSTSVNIEPTGNTRRTRRSAASVADSPVRVDGGAQVMNMETGSVGEVGEVDGLEGSMDAEHSTATSSDKPNVKGLVCPLCRGKVTGWCVVDAARKYFNDKSRSCSQEECTFVGTYEELRAHARCQHPSARPSEVDPARQRDWRRLERQRDLGDVLSSIRSAMPGATVFGDYVIDNDVEVGNEEMDFAADDGHWWTVFLLFQFFSPTSSVTSGGNISSRLRGHQRQRRAGSARLRQFIENLHNVSNDVSNAPANNNSSDPAPGVSQRRQRTQRRHQGDAS